MIYDEIQFPIYVVGTEDVDLIDGLLAFMNTSNVVGPINVGNPEEKTVTELAELIIRLTKSKSKLVHKPLPEDDPLKRKPDISKAKAAFNWEPKVSLEDGIKETISYFKKVLS